jgi:acyl-[acyl-carrier-protein]-phospholipid O-acyltransferase/long-chain-fatty-acid--[acyl-carrier-protein] ligase
MTPRFDETITRQTVYAALLHAARRFKGNRVILEDQERRPLSYTDLIRASLALGRKISVFTSPHENVGLLLPSSAAGAVTFFALHAYDRIPAMLNFTAGLRNLKAAVKLANVRCVLTSRRFIEQGKLHDIVDALEEQCAIHYLEDVRQSVGAADRLRALADSLIAARTAPKSDPDSPAVVLFTSGSFGAPRGVVLSHANLLANVHQIVAHLEMRREWVFFNPLPIFHCFGLTAGMLLPLLNGMKVFEYPSPLHHKQIPKLIKESRADVLLATDTFLNQYARASDADELSSLKFIVCGAEKVRDETHALIHDRFGPIPVLEGYGATEASPVIAVNKPEDNRRGTVGPLLPGMRARLEPVEGVKRGGRLFVSGPNIMSGYLNAAGGLDPPQGGWHDTGDVVEIAEDGWLAIVGRVKRFAKIGGEMVSLTAAEDLAAGLWPDARHAAIALPDGRKGERIVLFTDQADAEVAKLIAHAKALGAPDLATPRHIVTATEVPVLGSGKTDYVAVERIINAH